MKNKILLLLAILASLVFVVSIMANVHASDESSTTLPAWTEPLLPFFKALIPAVAVGVITSILGYLRTTPPESFDGKKVTATVIISAIIGTITVITGWTYEQSVEWFANAGLTVWVYWLISVIAVKLKWGTVNSTPPPATT